MLVSALLLALAHGPLLARGMREPADGAELGKLPYAKLVAPGPIFWLVAVVLAAQIASITADGPLRPVWLVYGSSVAALVWVDAYTTWLPQALSWVVTAELAAAGVIGFLMADAPLPFWHMLLGAGASLVVWWIFWLIGRGALGFGDVRLAPLAGAMGAITGMGGWFVALLASALLAIVWGVTFGRRHPAPGTKSGFAYGPALWAGPYIALIWASINH